MSITVKHTRINAGYLALFITSTIWGTTWVGSKYALQHLPALQLAAIRQLIAGSCFLFYFLIFKKQTLPNRKDLRTIFIMSLLMMVFANGLSTWGLKHIPTGLGSLIGALYPMSVWLIEKFGYKKSVGNRYTIIGLILGIVGIGFVFYQNMFAKITPELIFGLSLSVFAMLCWSLGTIFLSQHKLTINPYHGMGWQMIMGTIMLSILSLLTGEHIPLESVRVEGWISILYLAIFGSVLTFVCFIYSLNKLPATVSSLYAYFNPIVAMWMASWWLGEKLTSELFVGAVITLTGVYMVNHSIKKDQEKLIVESEI